MAYHDDQIVLEPELRPLAQQVLNTVRLAMEKAVAHATDPSRYPMPEGADTLESLLLTRFRQLPKDKQDRSISRVAAALAQPAVMRNQLYGELAKVNLRSATAVAEQARALATPVRIGARNLLAINRRGVPAAEADDVIDLNG